MTPAPSSPVPAVERIELPGGYHLRVERFELAHPWVIVCGPNDEPMLSGEVVDPYGLAAALATPTPGRAAEPDTMADSPGAMTAQQVFAWAKEQITALRTRAETAEAQLATLRAEVEGLRDAEKSAEWRGENRAYADVFAAGQRVYAHPGNDLGDRRAVMTFVDRFQARAALDDGADR